MTSVPAATGYRLWDLPEELAILIRVHPESGCWVWQGPLLTGYGRYQGKPVHRLVYEHLVGPIPAGLTLDHVRDRGCITKSCCWPGHLEPVTRAENSRRFATRPRIREQATPLPRLLATDLHRDLARILDRVLRGEEAFEILRYEKTVAVLVPVEWYERAKAALEKAGSDG